MASPETRELDPTQLQLENDLLTNEVQRLRAEVARLGGTSGGAPGGKGAKGAKGANGGGRRNKPESASEARGRQAIEDVTWLVDRLSSSPAGWMFRSRAGFRGLMERYGSK